VNQKSDYAITNSTVSEILQEDRSLYSTQFALGFRSLTFIPELEPGFRHYYLENNPGQIRRIIPIALVLTLLFGLTDYLRLAPEVFAQFYVYRGIQLVALAILTVLVFSASSAWLEIPVILVLVVYGTTTPIILGIINANGEFSPISAQLFILAFCYFLAGLRFYQALFTGLIISLSYPISQLFFSAPLPNLPFNCFMILAFNVLGLCGAYFLEYAARENYLARQLLGELALFDGLTGLLNRRAFSLDLEKVFLQAKRDKVELAIALLDVDHFKEFNEFFGHAQGDHCLRKIAAVLRDSIKRPLDKAGRYGGEEFILAWYDCSEESARQLGEMARAAVEDLAMSNGPDASQRLVTVSVGVATANGARLGDSGPLIRAAENALYEAKAGGRNRVILAAGDSVSGSPVR
jgi:diguanylate cyclase (GGDEF)-like protein